MENFYDNRELSWIKFNMRVLDEAADNAVPLFERLRFLSISTSNLDEFFMVRVGSIMDQILLGNKKCDDKTNLSFEKQLELIFHRTQDFYVEKQKIYNSVLEELGNNNIKIQNISSLFGGKLSVARKQYEIRIKPLLSVQIVDMKNPFPHLENKAVCCAVELCKKDKLFLGLILKSSALENIVSLNQKDSFEFVLTDDLIYEYADEMFSGYKVVDKCKLRITRNADLELLENELNEDFDYRTGMKRIIKKRQRLSPVRFEISKHISKDFKRLILNRESADMLLINRIPLSFDFVGELEKMLPKEIVDKYSFNPFHAPMPAWYNQDCSILKKIKEQDIFLNYPYDNMKVFLKFLDESAENKDVISIKITLYRVNKNSKVISSLIKAAENGKDVLAVMELRARFDEENNINYSEILEEAGVRVLYGPENYKVHSKLCLITLKKRETIEYFTHCGTGNYNEKTALTYTDMNLLTKDRIIGNDAKNFFDYISIGKTDGVYDKLVSSPCGIEKKLNELIDDEIMFHKLYSNGHIIIKINSLTEKEMIDKLVQAAINGVKIDLIVRGICCLIPTEGILRENIRIISVVGRFLEHNRIYYFNHNSNEKIYISSADLMTRNLKNRVEIACKIENKDIKKRIKDDLHIILKDDVKARIINQNGEYCRPEKKKDINSQAVLLENALERNKIKNENSTVKVPNYFLWLIRGRK